MQNKQEREICLVSRVLRAYRSQLTRACLGIKIGISGREKSKEWIRLYPTEPCRPCLTLLRCGLHRYCPVVFIVFMILPSKTKKNKRSESLFFLVLQTSSHHRFCTPLFCEVASTIDREGAVVR